MNKNIEIDHVKKTGILHIKWTKKCGNILSEDYPEEFAKIKEFINFHHPGKIMVNLKECEYFEGIEDKTWHNNQLHDRFNQLDGEKMAIVVPRNLFTHVFFESANLREQQNGKRIQYFGDDKKAEQWLKIED
ncbi:MAG: hypothetical protein ACOCXD_03670 [Bacteroidota bacterium]